MFSSSVVVFSCITVQFTNQPGTSTLAVPTLTCVICSMGQIL